MNTSFKSKSQLMHLPSTFTTLTHIHTHTHTPTPTHPHPHTPPKSSCNPIDDLSSFFSFFSFFFSCFFLRRSLITSILSTSSGSSPNWKLPPQRSFSPAHTRQQPHSVQPESPLPQPHGLCVRVCVCEIVREHE